MTAVDPHYERAFLGEGEHFGPENFCPSALRASIVIAGASQLYGLTISNTGGSTAFYFVFDGAAVPGNSTPPFGPVLPVASASALVLDWLPARSFFAGIVIAKSSSQSAFTADTTADTWFDVQYR